MNGNPNGTIAEGDTFRATSDWDLYHLVRLGVDARHRAVKAVRDPDRTNADLVDL